MFADIPVLEKIQSIPWTTLATQLGEHGPALIILALAALCAYLAVQIRNLKKEAAGPTHAEDLRVMMEDSPEDWLVETSGVKHVPSAVALGFSGGKVVRSYPEGKTFSKAESRALLSSIDRLITRQMKNAAIRGDKIVPVKSGSKGQT